MLEIATGGQGTQFRGRIENGGLDFMAPMDVTTLFGDLLVNP